MKNNNNFRLSIFISIIILFFSIALNNTTKADIQCAGDCTDPNWILDYFTVNNLGGCPNCNITFYYKYNVTCQAYTITQFYFLGDGCSICWGSDYYKITFSNIIDYLLKNGPLGRPANNIIRFHNDACWKLYLDNIIAPSGTWLPCFDAACCKIEYKFMLINDEWKYFKVNYQLIGPSCVPPCENFCGYAPEVGYGKIGIKNDIINNNNAEFSILPNPINDKMTINYSNPENGNVAFKLYNIIGIQVLNYNSIKSSQTDIIDIDISNLVTGVYTYEFSLNNIIISTGRIVKE